MRNTWLMSNPMLMTYLNAHMRKMTTMVVVLMPMMRLQNLWAAMLLRLHPLALRTT